MELLEQCQKWNENDEYQKIIDALEAIPAGERTPELDSELAGPITTWHSRGTESSLKRPSPYWSPMRNIFRGTTAGISVWLCLVLPGSGGPRSSLL